MEVRDGSTTSFWFDNWMGSGKLIDVTGAIGTTYLGLPRRALVCDAVSSEGWSLRNKRSRRFQTLYNQILAIPVPDEDMGDDLILWKRGEDEFQDSFSTASTWEQIRYKKLKVEWSEAVWFTQSTPRYAFITWLAVQNRLSTGDRMRSWGITQGCGLCGERDETRDHLFFACPYSFTVWEGLGRGFFGRRTNPDWYITLNAIKRKRANRLDSILLKMIFQTVIYHIWRERNSRRHQGNWVSTNQMHKAIDRSMRNRIVSLKYGPQHRYAGLLQRWFELTA
ncbi:PREDICTED: uncharacterized protein LOC106324048 [Brassica oleracea var. oleracea]|uniref:uncharacterized protein LOC106324048 n=1 Tax=Brassica oleracea var. oleracea TaxID=109376 RepID=UPI0006A72906|nr:PREDICTED: uncharacterized protein LOC106324048 [Brassica oleracea var. oleracea]